MYPFPIFIPVRSHSGNVESRLAKLEEALGQSLAVIQILMEQLEQKFGSDILGDRLSEFRAPDEAAIRRELEDIDAALKRGDEGKAVRQFRELAGAIWDDAHQAIGSWGNYPLEQKINSIKLRRWVQNLQQLSGLPEE